MKTLPFVLVPDQDYPFPHTLLLEASAGSGKTQALAERFVQFLLSQHIPHHQLSHMLAITFTRNAAREMKERILGLLKRLALEKDEELAERMMHLVSAVAGELAARASEAVDQIIRQFSDFQVQTIDSFTFRMLNASAWELGQQPDAKLSLEYGDLVDYALAMMLKEVGWAKDPELTRVMEDFLEVLNRSSGESFIWNPEPKLKDRFKDFLILQGKEGGEFFFDDYRQEIGECLQTIREAYQQIMAVPLEKKKGDSFATLLEQEDISGLLKRTYSPRTLPLLKAKVPKDQMGLYEETMKQWMSLNDVMGQLELYHSLAHFFPYGRAYSCFGQFLKRAKRRMGTLHIDDVAKELSDHLGDQEVIPEIYIRLGDRLYHYLMDEFQDTDPIQWASLLPLIEETLSQDGSLFLVGDLKQAIFMFRKADYRIMRNLRMKIQGGAPSSHWLPVSSYGYAKVATLDHNYRSGGVILDYVDRVFKGKLRDLVGTEILKEDLTGLGDYQQQPLEKRKGEGYVQVRRFASDFEDSQERSPAERQALLEILKDILSRGYRHGEVAILAAKNEELEAILGWLTEEGIPASASSSLDIRKRREVAELIELLRFLDSPIDDLAFANFIGGETAAKVAVQEGCLSGPELLSHLQLAKDRRGARTGYLYQRFREDRGLKTFWERYFEPLYRKAGYYPLYSLASLTLKIFRVFENFPEEAGALVKFLEAINSLESKGMNSIRGFLDLSSRREEDLFEMELPEFSRAVQLMTFHKSKGLGFPVVINMLYDSPRPRDAMYYDLKDGKIRVYHIPRTLLERRGDSCPKLKEIFDRRLLDEQIQDLNTLYVACTRAERELYNLVITQKREGAISRLFDEVEAGQRKQAIGYGTEVGEAAEPTPAIVPPARESEEIGREEEIWSLSRQEESARGRVLPSGPGADRVPARFLGR